MRKLFTAMRNAPKRASAVVAMIAAAIIVPTIVLAWGPSRDTFTMAHPADHVTFNSMTDNSVVGDERQFVGIKDASNTAAGGWQNNVAAQPGHEYLVRIYVHNNAASNLNLVAHNTRVTAALSTATGKNVPITGYVSADNATPNSVYADVALTSAQDFNIVYEPGSAILYNNVTGQAGRAVSDSIVNNGGALIGYNSNNGDVPGCFQYASYVTFKVKPQFAPTNNFEVAKTVRKAGTTTWSESVNANPGDTVDFQLEYKNTGEVRQNNVVIKDYLPSGLSYVAGSSYLKNGTNPNGLKISDNVTTASGVNVGDYNAAAAAYVKFSAKVDAQTTQCGPVTLTNKEHVIVNGNFKEDTAGVVVNYGACKITVCELATKKIITIDESAFDSTKHSKNVADCAAPGQITVCDLATKKLINIAENAFDASKHSRDLADCATPTELPTTGPTETALSIIGLGSLITSAGYFINSRRALGRQ